MTDQPDHPPRRTVRREVVSFVRRSARMNQSQQKNWDLYHDRFVVDVAQGERDTSVHPDATVDWAAEFGRPDAPTIVEIGSGAGDSLVPMAAALPQASVLAFEVFEPAVASTLGHLARTGTDNVRIVLGNGVEGLRTLVAPGSLDEVWVHFPDPWHKARHHKRRLVSPEFAALVASRLRPGGVLRLATDWADYATWMREVLDAEPLLANQYPDQPGAPRNELRPVTRFERKGLAVGRDITDLVYRRRA